MFALAVFCMFPALFFPSQMYTVVPEVLVETAKYGCDGLWRTGTLFLYHCIVGIGNPSAVQYNINLSPTLTVYGDCTGSIVTLGASMYLYRHEV